MCKELWSSPPNVPITVRILELPISIEVITFSTLIVPLVVNKEFFVQILYTSILACLKGKIEIFVFIYLKNMHLLYL